MTQPVRRGGRVRSGGQRWRLDGVDLQLRQVAQTRRIDALQVQRRHARLVLAQVTLGQHRQEVVMLGLVVLDQQLQPQPLLEGYHTGGSQAVGISYMPVCPMVSLGEEMDTGGLHLRRADSDAAVGLLLRQSQTGAVRPLDDQGTSVTGIEAPLG